jgi:hypothetical protein
MKSARRAAVLTWIYVAAFGIPAVPVSVYVRDNGRLPMLWDLFEIYGGRWSARYGDDTLIVLLLGFLLVTLAATCAAWMMWRGSKVGALISLLLLPIEGAFWLGFALPFPFILGAARAALVVSAWRSLTWPRVTRPLA